MSRDWKKAIEEWEKYPEVVKIRLEGKPEAVEKMSDALKALGVAIEQPDQPGYKKPGMTRRFMIARPR